jgi:hypothetical protein
MLSFLRHILQLIISPARGWEDVSHSGQPSAELCRTGFYPLLATAAVSCLIRLFYDGDQATVISVMQDAIITFTAYFATFFIAQFAMTSCMSRLTDKNPTEQKISTFAIYNLSIMVLICIVANLLPIELEILKFLPAYVGFVIWKGVRYLDVNPDKVGQFMFLTVFTIIAPPFLLRFLFYQLIPNA